VQPVERLMIRVVEACSNLRLEYFVTGSVGAMVWGEPRLTADVDMGVELPIWNVSAFCEAFPAPDYYVDQAAARQAAGESGQFNVIDVREGVKADILVLADTPFNQSRGARVRIVSWKGHAVRVASPEDIILKKLEYYREGGSDKHVRDVAGILKVSGEQIDFPYLRTWADQLGVRDEWETVCRHLGLSP
jgi:hypothetical protein